MKGVVCVSSLDEGIRIRRKVCLSTKNNILTKVGCKSLDFAGICAL